ncbi:MULTISPECIES: Clp protease N-terminal domain-containing protein [Streptomyces]|uniref:Clp protease N-terminal domain-containing protein n=1 Tax=Streptomyces doudnae TaxID=3075536 RepID=A0ABD5EY43_9ACTN|nr:MULTISPECIES: Clp protease N-terminal domain-containing protein [unclassified Streptomyces]MDT0438914.1 Clp protease N-terminal domain-containing protein [Streptomyces sp. DSM 41981]SCE04620.1 Clp amino terminal domain-containing protein, pathogenicity island component [Streptomyces sp. SolWspMP-5a-2]
MQQRPTGVDGTTVEFETDVMDLLVRALRDAGRAGSPVVGSEHLLAALVMGDDDAGTALAPGMRRAGSIGGLVTGRGTEGWASTDDGERGDGERGGGDASGRRDADSLGDPVTGRDTQDPASQNGGRDAGGTAPDRRGDEDGGPVTGEATVSDDGNGHDKDGTRRRADGHRDADGPGSLVSDRDGQDTGGTLRDAGGGFGGGVGAGRGPEDDGRPLSQEPEEVRLAWREARWRLALDAKDGGRAPDGMSGAFRGCLRRALDAARAEGTVAVRCRHVARALLDLPGSRAREALVLCRTDTAAATAALDALDARAAAGEPVESRGVTLLRRAGTLGRSGTFLTRALTSWTSGSGVYGSPVVFAVSVEATRQAVRCGRPAAEPVDLLLGALALERSLAVAGRALPEALADVNSGAALLRRHGVRQDSLTRAAAASPTGPGTDRVAFSAAAERVRSVALLRAAERGSPTVGTVHLLAAALEEDTGEIARLLAAEGVDADALRAAATGHGPENPGRQG